MDEVELIAAERGRVELVFELERQDISVLFVTLKGFDETDSVSMYACSLYEPAGTLTSHSHDELVGSRLIASERLSELVSYT